MRSEDVRLGVPVKVLDPVKRGGRGCAGTIERTYGHPSYLATEVRFDDGSRELYWYHELELLADDTSNTAKYHSGIDRVPGNGRRWRV